MAGALRLRARTLLPLTGEPIADGGLWLEDGLIRAVGPWSEVQRTGSGSIVDLGEVTVGPGLVNAHVHLDYTNLAGQLAPPRSFSAWIKTLLAAKSQWGFSEFADSWIAGAQQLLQTGTTTIVNIESVPEMLGQVRSATPLRVWSLLELTGVRSRRDPKELVAEAVAVLERLPSGRGGVGLSPHAPYSTLPELLSQAAEAVRQRGWPISTHLAESREEFDMFVHRTGAMYDWLAPQRPIEDCGLGSPLHHAARHGLLTPSQLAVHVNVVWRNDVDLLRESGASVVHCPQSHAYFRHPRFPWPELRAAGVNVCLGTDSLASTSLPTADRTVRPTLSMLDELRSFQAHNADVEPREMLALATVNGARALGLKGLAGELSVGAWADLAVVPFAGAVVDAEAALLNHRGPVAATMIAGEWVFGNGAEGWGQGAN